MLAAEVIGNPSAAQESPPAPDATSQDIIRSCTKCHDETEKYPVLSIFKSKHAVMADTRTPFADQACVTCHGRSEEHLEKPAEGEPRAPADIGFGRRAATPALEQDTVCLRCHEGGRRMYWRGSAHEFQGVACASCHTVHTGQDPVLATAMQPEACFACHTDQRAQILRPSSHPIREGKVACSDCHDPHGSTGPKLLTKGTVNETCYTCHAEKRGPFLWEHAPVREDCTLCHTPHGSVHAPLLKNRGPWLCQQCHLAQFHPSTAYSGTGLPGGAPAQQLLAKNCMNCHSQVHGSNHPSGVRKTR
jgi:DmsE family decaheme c-type cytochrome